MLHVSAQANEFFLNVAAVDQERSLLDDALLFGLRAHKFLNTRCKAICVAAKDRMPMLFDSLTGVEKLLHSLAKFVVDATAFFLAHPVEVGECLVDASKYSCFQLTLIQIIVATHGAG